MSETVKVYCMVLILNTLFIIAMHLFVKVWNRLIDKIFADHDRQVEMILDELDDSYTTASVDCLTEEYIRNWIYSNSSNVKCGDSVFAYLIQDEQYLELLNPPISVLLHHLRRKEKNFIVNLAVRNHNSYEFERIHSIICHSLSPELASLEHQGMWFTYDMSLVS